jgi:hypothetical protein
LPRVQVNPEEQRNLELTKSTLRYNFKCLQEALSQLPDDRLETYPDPGPLTRPEADRHLALLMAACFQVGQQTQYPPTLVRAGLEAVREQTASARKVRSLGSEVVDKHLRCHQLKHPNSSETSHAIARRIESDVNDELKAAGQRPLKEDSIRSSIDRIIRTTAQSPGN